MIERVAVMAVVTALAAPPLYVGLRGAGVPGVPVAVILLLGAGGLWLSRQLPAELEGAWKRRRLLAALWLLISAVAVVQMTRLSIFMFDAGRRQQSMLPQSDADTEHSCLSAYHRASELSGMASGLDVYEPGAYRGTLAERRFKVERYQYPPPFLLLPRLLAPLTGHQFLPLRPVWFALMALPLMLALALLARFVERPAVALLAPAVLAAMPTLLSLQYGNFHVAVVALAVVAMLALRRRGPMEIAGGALLAFVTLAKVFPGLLLVVLCAQRRWRAVAWTVAWLCVWTLASVIVLGPAPLAQFLDVQLQRVASGAAFPVLVDNARAVAANMSIQALVWKLGLLVGQRWATAAQLAAGLFAGGLVAGVALAARRSRDQLGEAQLWLAALFLGGLCSPLAPNPYAQLALLWLLTLLVPEALHDRVRTVALAGAWLLSSVMADALPLSAGPTLLALSLVGQLAGMGVALWALARPR
jgi:hypothetical protein